MERPREEERPHPVMTIFEELHALERRGAGGVLCTVIRTQGSSPRHSGAKMLVYPDGRISGTIGGGEMESRVIRDALDALARGAAQVLRYTLRDPGSGDPGVCGGDVEIFIEPLASPATLLVIGAGHIGRALVHLGRWLGFRVVVCDDRSDYCNSEATPGAHEYLCVPIAQLRDRFRFDAQTYIVMPTRGTTVDVDGLPYLLDTPHAYLGVIGSRRRWATAIEQLVEQGTERHALRGIYAPMGLELNGETPEEIALSVLAEIVMLRNEGDGRSMRRTGLPGAEPEDA